jgi:hypothetical protein
MRCLFAWPLTIIKSCLAIQQHLITSSILILLLRWKAKFWTKPLKIITTSSAECFSLHTFIVFSTSGKSYLNWRHLDRTRKSRLIEFKKKAQLDSVGLMLGSLSRAFRATISHTAGPNYLCYAQHTEYAIHFRKCHDKKLLLIQWRSCVDVYI